MRIEKDSLYPKMLPDYGQMQKIQSPVASRQCNAEEAEGAVGLKVPTLSRQERARPG